MGKRWIAATAAACLWAYGFPVAAFAAQKKAAPKPKLRPLSSPANTAIQSDFPQMQGSDFQTPEPYSAPAAAGSSFSGSGLSGVVPTSNMTTNAGIAAPAPSGPSKAYGQMRTNAVSPPSQINSLNHQPAAAYGAPQSITGGGQTTGGVGVDAPIRADMRPQVGPRPDLPAGVSGGTGQAAGDAAVAMSTINATEKKIEQREREEKKKAESDSGSQGQQMQPPQMPQGQKEEEKGGGGGGGSKSGGGEQPSAQPETPPDSAFLDANAKSARAETNLNQLAPDQQAALSEQLSSKNISVTDPAGPENRASIQDALGSMVDDSFSNQPLSQLDGLTLRQFAQQTNNAIQQGASNAHASQSRLASSKKEADETVKSIGEQNKENDSKAKEYHGNAGKLEGVADSVTEEPPNCTPRETHFSRPSRGGLSRAHHGHGRLRSGLGEADAAANAMASNIGTLDSAVPKLRDIGAFTQSKNNSGSDSAYNLVAGEWAKYRHYHPKLRESIGQGRGVEQTAESAIKSSEGAADTLDQTQQQGQTANQSINDLCRLVKGPVKQMYDRGKAKVKEGEAKKELGQSEIAQGNALNAVSPGSGTALIEQGNNDVKDGEKLVKEGEDMKKQAVQKAKDLKQKMKQKAQEFKNRVQQARSKARQARSPQRQAERASGRFRPPPYMP